MAVGDVFEMKVIGRFLEQAHYNVLHFKAVAWTGTGPTAGEVFTEFENEIKPLYLACLSDVFTLLGYEFKRIKPTLGAIAQQGATAPTVGDITGNPAPSYVAAVIAERSILISKKGRGRIYIGGQSEANTEATNGNLFTSTYMTALTALAERLEDPLIVTGGTGTAELQPAVYSKALGQANEVYECLPSSRPHTMRSRKVRWTFGA